MIYLIDSLKSVLPRRHDLPGGYICVYSEWPVFFWEGSNHGWHILKEDGRVLGSSYWIQGNVLKIKATEHHFL